MCTISIPKKLSLEQLELMNIKLDKKTKKSLGLRMDNHNISPTTGGREVVFCGF